MSNKGEWQTISVSDGTKMRLYIARPAAAKGKVPAVIVLQEAFGVNAHMRDVTERIAALGYVAVSPELYHRTAPGFESGYEGADRDKAIANLKSLTDDGQIADLQAVNDWLKQDASVDAGKIAAVGYCMGGRTAFLANSILPLKAAVSYYGGNIAPSLLSRAADQHGPLLFFWGGLDQHIQQDQRRAVHEAVEKAGKKYAMVRFSDADHGFSCDARKSYNETAARQAWAMFVQFLADNFA